MEVHMKYLMLGLLLVTSCTSVNTTITIEELEDAYPALQYGVVNADGIVLSEGFNSSTETGFHIFSVTKIYTSMHILQLQEKGVLSIDDQIQEYLPWIPYSASIAELLSHTGGIPNPIWGNYYIHFSDQTMESRRIQIQKIVAEHEQKKKGKVMYSNLGFAILGVLMEEVTGKSYEELFKENIADVLALTQTGFSSEDVSNKTDSFISKNPITKILFNMVMEEVSFTEEQDWVRMRSDYIFDLPAHGGLISSPSDLAVFCRAIINQDSRLLNEESWKLWFTQHSQGSGSYSLGWRIETLGDEQIFTHHGGAMGKSAVIRFYPQRNIVSYALTNVLDTSRLTKRDMNRLDRHYLN
jgi:CubicO group peptidase (beta-lactamase class C family)